MFDFDEFNDYDYYDSSVVDLPMPSGDILANKNEAVLEQTNIETVEPQYVPLQTNIENSDEPQLTPVAENKETIDDIIGDMTLPDQDEVTLDMSAIIDTKTIDSEEVLEIEADEAEESKVEYLSDPLQGHLSDAAFVTYKIAADEVDFELEENNADLDDEEISLLLDFGYDDEVEAEVGYERTSEIKRKSKSHVVESDKIYGYCGEEYISKTQNTKIKHEYAKDKRDLLVRGGIFASITLVLFLFSIINCVGVNINYSLYFLVEFLLLSAASVVAFPEMKRGVMGIIKLEPNYYSIPVIVLSITGLYEIFTIIYVLLTAETMLVGTLLPCGFIAAMFVLTSLVSDILECFAQADSFELISRADELYTAEKFNKNKIFEASSGKSREKTSLNGAFFGDQIFEIKRIGVPQGYFSRMSKKQYNLSYSFYSLGVIITVSIIVACIALVKSNSIATATYSLMTVILMGLPLSLALFTTLPKFISSKRLLRRGCAIAGDVACEEYSLMETLIFSDEDAVEVVEKLEIRPESDSDLASSIKIATRALKALGGPVSTMVAGAFTEIGAKAPEIEISSIRDNGIEFYMDSSIYMLIGDASFMSSFGIKVSSDYGVGDHLKHNNVIYIAIDGVPKLGYVIESKIKSDFISLVLELDKFGIKTAVSSFDPTINDYYFEQNRIHGASVISTYKPEKFYNRSGKSIAEGGLFCVGDPKNIIHPLTESRRLHSINKLNKIISLLLSLLGCAIATLFIIFILLENTFRVLTLATILMILIFHLTAAIPAVLNSFDLKKKERPINE